MTETPSNDPIDGDRAEELPGLQREVISRLEPFVLPGRAEDAADAVRSIIINQSHSGPLPVSSEFGRYEAVLPGSADRILSMAEREQTHRQSLEVMVVRRQVELNSRGQLFALVALVAMLGLVALIAYWGHPKEATTLGGIIIVGVVALFLGQRLRQRGKQKDDHDLVDDKDLS